MSGESDLYEDMSKLNALYEELMCFMMNHLISKFSTLKTTELLFN